MPDDKIELLNRRIQELESLLQDSFSHEDMDAAQFILNMHTQRISRFVAFTKSFLEWHANNFEDFDSNINAQLLCLANEAEDILNR